MRLGPRLRWSLILSTNTGVNSDPYPPFPLRMEHRISLHTAYRKVSLDTKLKPNPKVMMRLQWRKRKSCNTPKFWRNYRNIRGWRWAGLAEGRTIWCQHLPPFPGVRSLSLLTPASHLGLEPHETKIKGPCFKGFTYLQLNYLECFLLVYAPRNTPRSTPAALGH